MKKILVLFYVMLSICGHGNLITSGSVSADDDEPFTASQVQITNLTLLGFNSESDGSVFVEPIIISEPTTGNPNPIFEETISPNYENADILDGITTLPEPNSIVLTLMGFLLVRKRLYRLPSG